MNGWDSSLTRGLRLDRNSSVTFLVIAIANKIVASASQLYIRHHLIGIMEWRVMALLAAEPGITAKDISELSGVTAGSVSRAIGALLKRHYLSVRNDRADNRRSFLRLTARGQALHDRVIVSSLARERLLLTGFSGSEYRHLLSYFWRLMANVDRVNTYEPSDSATTFRSRRPRVHR
jgi:DNA-binding MarR family transcriptional regulator